ncbi:fatty acid desaturase family protein [Streptomyces sp. CBMA123]|uniref:fatty acid desaturase family protein n=1 Tax=Streptomyces sp. CBMA123 TaxID=1896313 RepID=UPI0016619431|nr:acyl-CoA desaturase [Streptomyces sp. CBMA123]MBD0691153.1 fatty acid desaturase [Streptomyces sp. CBMA123]
MTVQDVPTAGALRHGDFAELRRRVAEAGLLRRRPLYYACRAGALLAASVLLLAGFTALGASWWQLGLAPLSAFVLGQLALLGHDVAHHAVFSGRRATDLAGILLGNLVVGMSYGWWVSDHNRHHAHPNREGRDPAADAILFVRTAEQAARTRGLRRSVAKYQAELFFPLLSLQALGLVVATGLTLVRGPLRHPALERTLAVLHYALAAGLLLVVLTPLQALAFAVVCGTVLGVYLGCVFAPNHKGMPMTGAAEEHTDYLRRQVLPSRNLRSGRFVHFLFGGLDLQIEHHLFPAMPVAALRPASRIVRAYCAEIGVDYCEAGLVDSFREILRDLRAVGRSIEAEPRPTVTGPATGAAR